MKSRLLLLALWLVVLLPVVPASSNTDAAPARAPSPYPSWSNTYGGSPYNCASLNVDGGLPQGATKWNCTVSGQLFTTIQYPQAGDYNVAVHFAGFQYEGQPCNVFLSGLQINVSGSGTATFEERGLAAGSTDVVQILCSSGAVFDVWITMQVLAPYTATPTPVSTYTPTATIGANTPPPTNTPKPGGFATDTPTPGGTATPTATPTATTTPAEVNCGDVSFPVLNCTLINKGFDYVRDNGSNPISTDATAMNTDHWLTWQHVNNVTSSSALYVADLCTRSSGYGYACVGSGPPGDTDALSGAIGQSVVAHASGSLHMLVRVWHGSVFGCTTTSDCVGAGTGSPVGTPQVLDIGTVVSGQAYTFSLGNTPGAVAEYELLDVWVGATATPTLTATGTVTQTPTASTATQTPVAPTSTPLAGSTATPFATDTPCAGGCAVGVMTAIPIVIDTTIVIPTGPFTWFTGLSLGRSPCTSFGKIPILLPVLTPVASLTPMAVGWVPMTNSSIFAATGVLTGGEIQPCADPHIPQEVWDMTWYGSIMLVFIIFIGWLIWFVHRLVNNQGTAD